jgi:hypothetical protein
MAETAPLIACVAFVSAANELTYFKSFVSDEAIKLQLAVFTGLDFVEEKRACRRQRGGHR